jgi:osmotically-inducible protein OsmY
MMLQKMNLITLILLTTVITLTGCNQTNLGTGTVPEERVGLEGEYDESGLAKRVLKAFKDDANLAGIETIYVAQTGSTIVLKGTAPNAEILNQMVTVAEAVEGVSQVETNQVTVRP